MATWDLTSPNGIWTTGGPGTDNANLTGKISFTGASAPGDFDPSAVTDVEIISWRFDGFGGGGNDEWDLGLDNIVNQDLRVETSGGTLLADTINILQGHSSQLGGMNLYDESDSVQLLNEAATSISTTGSNADWEGLRIALSGGGDVTWAQDHRSKGSDSGNQYVDVGSLTLRITYTPVAPPQGLTASLLSLPLSFPSGSYIIGPDDAEPSWRSTPTQGSTLSDQSFTYDWDWGTKQADLDGWYLFRIVGQHSEFFEFTTDAENWGATWATANSTNSWDSTKEAVKVTSTGGNMSVMSVPTTGASDVQTYGTPVSDGDELAFLARVSIDDWAYTTSDILISVGARLYNSSGVWLNDDSFRSHFIDQDYKGEIPTTIGDGGVTIDNPNAAYVVWDIACTSTYAGNTESFWVHDLAVVKGTSTGVDMFRGTWDATAEEWSGYNFTYSNSAAEGEDSFITTTHATNGGWLTASTGSQRVYVMVTGLGPGGGFSRLASPPRWITLETAKGLAPATLDLSPSFPTADVSQTLSLTATLLDLSLTVTSDRIYKESFQPTWTSTPPATLGKSSATTYEANWVGGSGEPLEYGWRRLVGTDWYTKDFSTDIDNLDVNQGTLTWNASGYVDWAATLSGSAVYWADASTPSAVQANGIPVSEDDEVWAFIEMEIVNFAGTQTDANGWRIAVDFFDSSGNSLVGFLGGGTSLVFPVGEETLVGKRLIIMDQAWLNAAPVNAAYAIWYVDVGGGLTAGDDIIIHSMGTMVGTTNKTDGAAWNGFDFSIIIDSLNTQSNTTVGDNSLTVTHTSDNWPLALTASEDAVVVVAHHAHNNTEWGPPWDVAPAIWTVSTLAGTQNLTPTTLDLGLSFPTGYLTLDGTTGNYASTPDAAALDITGDIDLRFRGTAQWQGTTEPRLVGKWQDGGDYSYLLGLSTTAGKMFAAWTTDGTTGTLPPYADRESTVALPFSNGDLGWVRVTLDVDNGASGYDLKFWYSSDTTNDPDAVSWTQLGATVVGASTTSIYSGADEVRVGQDNANPLTGDVYAAAIYDGIGGTKVFDADFTDLTTSEVTAKSFTEDSTNAATVTLNGSAWTYTYGPRVNLNVAPTLLDLSPSFPTAAVEQGQTVTATLLDLGLASITAAVTSTYDLTSSLLSIPLTPITAAIDEGNVDITSSLLDLSLTPITAAVTATYDITSSLLDLSLTSILAAIDEGNVDLTAALLDLSSWTFPTASISAGLQLVSTTYDFGLTVLTTDLVLDYLQTVAATSPMVAALVKEVRRSMAATSTMTPALTEVETYPVTLSATSTMTPGLVTQSVNTETLQVSGTMTPALNVTVTRYRTLAATSPMTPVMQRETQKILNAVTTAALAMVRDLNKTLAVSSTMTPDMIVDMEKTLAVSSTMTAGMTPVFVPYTPPTPDSRWSDEYSTGPTPLRSNH